MFYNTGIGTFIWVLSNKKEDRRKGKIQLIDATAMKSALRKNMGKKNCEFTEEIRKEIVRMFLAMEESEVSIILNKHLFSERSEKGYPNEPLLVASQNMGVVPKNVYGNRTVEAQKDLHLLKLVRVGDFVISLRSFQGGLAVPVQTLHEILFGHRHRPFL